MNSNGSSNGNGKSHDNGHGDPTRNAQQAGQNDAEATRILSEIRKLRENLSHDVDDVVDRSREMVDWRTYVRRFPWPTLALSLAAGYFLVPRRAEVNQVDPEALFKLAKKNRLVVTNKPVEDAKPGVVQTALSFASGMLVRAAMNYAGQRAQGIFSQYANNMRAGDDYPVGNDWDRTAGPAPTYEDMPNSPRSPYDEPPAL